MKEITVNIEGDEYLIDIEKAKSLGIVKRKKKITRIPTVSRYYGGLILKEEEGTYSLCIPSESDRFYPIPENLYKELLEYQKGLKIY
jgi:hypothetical protein